ncbi:hypothetical protein HCB27_00850 [Listeria booriae]|uniref:Bacterial Ig domain-containing protein n=1 Tax=Listeria booriae TaxID=1552123 RepID=A0A7X1D719_9LIST|nr:hypothetical protein [Listeria booriae]MBC2175147.1 hypothetical protein [Listeria booriae]
MSVKKGLVTCLAIAAVCATFQQTVHADEVSGKQYTSSTVNQLVSSVKSASDETSLSGLVSSPLVVGATSVSGKAVANAKVDVWVSGSLKATVYADATGNWTAQVPALAKDQIVQLRSTLGDWSADSNQYQVVEKEPVVLTPLVVGETKVAGVAAPGSKVDVWVGGSIKATVYADVTGIWTAKIPALEKDQIVQPRASIGSWYADSDRYQVVDKAPKVLTPLVVGETKIAGVAAPGSKVDVWVAGELKATVYADEGGIWVAKVPALEVGNTVQMKASMGIWSADSARYLVASKEPAVISPLVEGETKIGGAAIPSSKVDVWVGGSIKATVYADETGIWSANIPALVTGQPVQIKSSINTLTLDSTQYLVVEKTPYLLGTLKAGGTKVAGVSAPCSQVNVWIDGAIAATVTTDETGIWVAKVPALAEGQVVQPKANIGETWYAEGASVTVVK